MGDSFDKSLLNLTNAYLAVEGLLKSDVLSADTRRKLEKTLKLLDKEAAKLMREHADRQKDHSLGQAA